MNVLSVLRVARTISWTYRLLSTAVGLITIRLINDRLGVAGYGDIAFVLAMLMGTLAIDFGLLQSMPRFVARYARPEQADRGPVFWATSALACMLLLMLQMGFILLLVSALQLGGQLHTLTPLGFASIGATLVLGNVLTVGSAIYGGWQRYGVGGIAKILRSLSYLVAVVGLWRIDELTVQSVLWANALTLLVPNLLVTAVLVVRHRHALRWSWTGFPGPQTAELRVVSSYALRGWLFTLSTTLLTSGSVAAAGFLLAAPDVAKLQIALVLYTGVAAFLTGGMMPLTTIVSRLSDGSRESQAKIILTTQALLQESLLLSAALLVFFAKFGVAVIGLLLGQQTAQPDLAQATATLAMWVLLPGLAALPLFTFRFAIVDADDNGAYCKHVFAVTVLLVAAGCGAAAATGKPLALAASIGAILVYRAALGHRMSRHVLPGFRWRTMLIPFLAMLGTFAALALATHWARPGWRIAGMDDVHLQGLLYLFAAGVLYAARQRLPAVFRVHPTMQ